jgi:phosphoglycerol transferase MdoB-like AlkP superfamily enzyme
MFDSISYMNRRVSIWLTALFGICAVLAISGLILRATVEVLHNRSAETYVNMQRMQVHWVDVLTLSAAVLVALVVLLVATAIFNWRNKRDAALVKKLDAAASGRDK